MKVALQEIWDAIEHTTFAPLIKSIPKCMVVVMRAKGGSTRW